MQRNCDNNLIIKFLTTFCSRSPHPSVRPVQLMYCYTVYTLYIITDDCSLDDLWSLEKMQGYFCLIKNINPVLTPDASTWVTLLSSMLVRTPSCIIIHYKWQLRGLNTCVSLSSLWAIYVLGLSPARPW